MRIAFLLGSLNRGGTETMLLDMFRNAEKNHLDVIGIYRKSGTLETDFIESGVSMQKLSYQKNILHYLFRLRKILLSNKIFIIHAQQPIDALYAWLACMGTGIKIILTFHGYNFSERKLSNFILRFIIRRTDRNIYVSYTQLEYYQHTYNLKPNKQDVVYNGISFKKFDADGIQSKRIDYQVNHIDDSSIKARTDSTNNESDLHLHPQVTIREELHLSKTTILLGSVGNFVPGRDPKTLCRFLKLLKNQDVQFHFVFIGKRSESAPHLYDTCVNYCEQNYLSEQVTFLGSRNDVPFLLQQLDAFVYSTDHDTFGIAVVEAMAVGIPVFVNDWAVMSEITGQGKYATLYTTKDEQDLLQKFMLFMQNKPVFKAKAIEAAGYVRERYSIEKHIETLMAIYKTVISEEPPAPEGEEEKRRTPDP